MPSLFQVEFLVPEVNDQAADQLLELDLPVSWGPNYCTVGILRYADSASSVADEAVTALLELGLHPIRVLATLVSAADIAERCEVARSTVHAWTKRSDFPAPHTFVGAPVWDWHRVRKWVANRPDSRVDLSNEPDCLTPEEADRLTADLQMREKHAQTGTASQRDHVLWSGWPSCDRNCVNVVR